MILIFICGLLSLSQKESLIFLRISKPSATLPKTVCFPFIDERSALVRVIKNSLLFMSGPRLAVAR